MHTFVWQVFLDTSVLIAGIISPHGAAHEVLRLCEGKVVQPVLSRQVLVEADRNLGKKLSGFLPDYRIFLQHLSPRIVEDPTPEAIRKVAGIFDRKDAPILAAAITAEVDFLITWDKKHFHKKTVKEAVSFRIMIPAEFLEAFRQRLVEEGG